MSKQNQTNVGNVQATSSSEGKNEEQKCEFCDRTATHIVSDKRRDVEFKTCSVHSKVHPSKASDFEVLVISDGALKDADGCERTYSKTRTQRNSRLRGVGR